MPPKKRRKQHAEARRRWQRIAAIVGFTGGVVALVHAVLAFPKDWREFWQRPDTQLVLDWPLALQYDAGATRLSIAVKLVLMNTGLVDDLARNPTIAITNPNRQSFPLTSARFDCKEKGVDVRFPLVVGKSGPRELECAIWDTIGESELSGLAGTNALWTAVVTMDSVTGVKTAAKCFRTSGAVEAQLLRSELKRVSYGHDDPACTKPG